MNIGILHYKVGGTDGVSLEINKWKQVLEEAGHQVFLGAGELGTAEGTLLPALFHHSTIAERLYRNTFIRLQDYGEQGYRGDLGEARASAQEGIERFVSAKQIDLLIVQNLWSVAMNPAVAPALVNVLQTSRIPAVAHSHDFYWERVEGVALTCATAVELADKYLPPRDPAIRHLVINSLARSELAARKGIEAAVVPNVFDFAGPDWQVDAYNQNFRQRIGLHENDILILQATRIVRRKGIELAVDLVKALEAPQRRAVLEERGRYDGRPFGPGNRIVLVLAGYTEDDVGGHYGEALRRKIASTGVDALFIEDLISEARQHRDGQKTYALWDAYVFADLVTYPSLWEGWGNQLLEALRARLPVVLYEYPVYRVDIRARGFQAISLGETIHSHDEQGLVQIAPNVLARAADEALRVLVDGPLRRAMTERNFQLARQHYSLTALRHHLQRILPEAFA